jgi:hypothetical protein
VIQLEDELAWKHRHRMVWTVKFWRITKMNIFQVPLHYNAMCAWQCLLWMLAQTWLCQQPLTVGCNSGVLWASTLGTPLLIIYISTMTSKFTMEWNVGEKPANYTSQYQPAITTVHHCKWPDQLCVSLLHSNSDLSLLAECFAMMELRDSIPEPTILICCTLKNSNKPE